MTAQFSLVPADALADLRAELADLRQLIEGSRIERLPDKVTVSEAAAMENVSASTIDRWRREGSIETTGTGKARRVVVASLPSRRQI